MKKNNIGTTALGLFVLVLIGYFIFKFTEALFAFIGGLDASLKGAIFAGSTSLVVVAISYFANKSIEEKRSIEQTIRPEKMKLYTEFNRFMMSIFANKKVSKKPSDAEMTKFVLEASPKLLTFSSNDVIKKWGKLRVGLETKADEEKLFVVEDLLASIRRDLGHPKKGFEKGDILRLFVNDIDNYLK